MSKKGFFMKGFSYLAKGGCSLLLSGMLLFSPAEGTVSAKGADTPSYRVTVDDIYQRTFDKKTDGSLSYEYTNNKGDILSLVETKKNASSVSDAQKTSSHLPASYDLRKEKAVTPIKSQGYSGCCWAFATLKSLESNLIKTKQAASSVDLSENHLSWYLFHPSHTTSDPLYLDGITYRESAAKAAYLAESNTIRNVYNFDSYYNTLPYLKGSNALLGTFVLARWTGAVRESTAPFDASSTKNLFSMARTMKKQSDALRYKTDYYMTDANCYDGASLEDIKTALMTSGALEASFYTDNDFLYKNTDGTYGYYQREKTNADANHCITIIGWNDNYPKENFGDTPPDHDGAWLIANSYGTDYGQNGYFWLSYEEPSLGEIYGFEGVKNSAYDNNYQYDGSGWGSTLLPQKEHPMKVANIFTANKEYTQILKGVGLYTVTPNQPYTIQIYRGVTPGDPTSGTLAATISGTEKYSGYHTIPIQKSVSLKANQKFSVVVTYHRTNDKNGYIPIEGASLFSSSLAMNFHSTPGKSFCYAYATNVESGEKSYQWVDLNNTPISTNGKEEEIYYNNVCIKAFTVNNSKAGTIRFTPSKYTLGVGEKLSLSPVIKKTTRKTVSYTSSMPQVASVSGKGQIKAKKKGKAVITATLSTGAFTTIKITVKKAPKKINITPKGKKTIKVKKSFQIKVKLPRNTASHKLTYTSNKPRIVKVSKKGKVTGKKPGTATITVKTFNKKKAKIKVTVKKKE